MSIKTFKGKLEVGQQDQIYLHGGEPAQGYKIVKFKIISNKPYDAADEHIVQIWKIRQASVSPLVDFDDDALLGVAIINSDSAGYRYASTSTIIFDDTVFNQDIYVTGANTDGTSAVNYYIELKQVTMPGPEQAVVNFNAALLHGD